MSFHGRSLDDQPLAAYSTGVNPEEDDSLDEQAAEPAGAPARPLTQQDIAAALAESTAPSPPPTAIKGKRGFRLPSVKLPSVGRGKKAVLDQAAPFQPVPHGAVAPVGPASGFQAVATPVSQTSAFQAVSQPLGQPLGKPAGKPMKEPKTRPVTVPVPGAPGRLRGPSRKVLLRDPRVLAGGTIVIGLALLGISLLGGGGPNAGAGGPNGSQDANAALPTAPVLGNASVELTGGGTGTFTLTGATGSGPAVNSQVNATWTDPLGESLGLSGLASQGTRTTDPNFVLTWTMLVNGSAVTFTSRAAECTIGMAVAVKSVHGTFVCKNLPSPDGKHVVDLRGSYTT
jgi:hypothetical protein